MRKKKPAGDIDPLLKAFDKAITEGEELLETLGADGDPAGSPTWRPEAAEDLDGLAQRERESCLPRRVKKWAESCKGLVGVMYEGQPRPRGKDPCDPITNPIQRHERPDPLSHFLTLTECVEEILRTMQSKRKILAIRIKQRRKQEQGKPEAAGAEAAGDKGRGEAAEASGSRLWTIALVALGIIAAAVFLLLVHLLPWKWLVKHPNSYSIQALACVALPMAVVGTLKPTWRKTLWVPVLAGVVITLLALLGGPSEQPE